MEVSGRRTGGRGGRGALLIAAATALGVVAGACAGYIVQAGREPTRLPPLSQPSIDRAEGKVPVLSAARDPKLRTDGDLRTLLVDKPKGAKESDRLEDVDGWEDVSVYASRFSDPGNMFALLVESEFRRSAVIGWEQDSFHVTVRLVQFWNEQTLASSNSVSNHTRWAEEDPDVVRRPIPGTGEGAVYNHPESDAAPGYQPVYLAEAHAWRGDIAMEIWVNGAREIPEKLIMDLAERQMERL
ncbi:hypothetical protein AB0O01_08670 [Streptomyces sp. NPDC093252]|uniref:hypothetical protein n=1 Tax=Streptomyces sp. NPDC093252 TaxID=3154980 RepID=UPI0034314F57